MMPCRARLGLHTNHGQEAAAGRGLLHVKVEDVRPDRRRHLARGRSRRCAGFRLVVRAASVRAAAGAVRCARGSECGGRAAGTPLAPAALHHPQALHGHQQRLRPQHVVQPRALCPQQLRGLVDGVARGQGQHAQREVERARRDHHRRVQARQRRVAVQHLALPRRERVDHGRVPQRQRQKVRVRRALGPQRPLRRHRGGDGAQRRGCLDRDRAGLADCRLRRCRCSRRGNDCRGGRCVLREQPVLPVADPHEGDALHRAAGRSRRCLGRRRHLNPAG